MHSLSEVAFTHSPLPQLLVDPYRNRIAAANTEAHKLFAADAQGLLGRSASSLFTASMPQLIVFTQEVLMQGAAWSCALFMTKGDEKIQLDVTGKYLNTGGNHYMQLCLQDAAALKLQRDRAEAQNHYRSGLGHWNRIAKVFQEFERENHLILDAAGEGIYGVDTEGRTNFLNPASERMLGWTAAEVGGKNIHRLIHHSHADGSHYAVSDCPIYQAFRDGIVHSVDNEVFWTKSGRPIDVEYTSTPIRDNGHVVGAVIIFRDVTQKKADQKRLLDALQEVENLKNRLQLENAYLQEEINSEFNHHQIVGRSSTIQHVIQQIELVAPTDATVLISGESGTGKELIARAIHEMSQRSERSLIRVNCAAIPADLFESEFFGHAKGAFTGATSDRPGRFELADGGTLFLDEVGEIPLQLQGKLLRVLQEQQFERVGESATRHVNVRIIAATNRDLRQQVEAGNFREDLYFRLNVFPVESVPLRRRLDDVPLLARHFLNRASARANKGDLKIPLSQIEKLKQYHWPGNIRELENIIERQVILARGDILQFNDLTVDRSAPTLLPAATLPVYTESEVRVNEKRNLLVALQKCQGKVFGAGGAAELLGLKPTTLSSRIKKYKIDTRKFKPGRQTDLNSL